MPPRLGGAGWDKLYTMYRIVDTDDGSTICDLIGDIAVADQICERLNKKHIEY